MTGESISGEFLIMKFYYALDILIGGSEFPD